ncbi:MAG: hypothetical protein HXY37_16785, partial [Chloroflexi bacterium]|nr:hypothetical protein [Chloroflexota bacterium]
MDAYHATGRPGSMLRPNADRAAPEGRCAASGMAAPFTGRPAAPPWAAAACLRPLHPAPVAGPTPAWAAGRLMAQPLTIAASLLLAGGMAVAAVGVPLARATPAPVAHAPVALVAPAGGALRQVTLVSAVPAADEALLAQLLAAPTAEDEALLASVLRAPAAAAPAAIPAVEFAAEPAAAPPTVSFATVNQLPATAFNYTPAAQRLPAITLADQVIPPPAPPRPPAVPAPQPPPP